MCAAVGLPVEHLHRRRYAGLRLVGLAPGEWRELTPTKLYGYESSPDGLVRWVYLGIKQAPAPRPLESARDVLDSFTALAVTA